MLYYRTGQRLVLYLSFNKFNLLINIFSFSEIIHLFDKNKNKYTEGGAKTRIL